MYYIFKVYNKLTLYKGWVKMNEYRELYNKIIDVKARLAALMRECGEYTVSIHEDIQDSLTDASDGLKYFF